MTTQPRRTCPICGNEFSGAMEYCPVCLFRKALVGNEEPGESSSFGEVVKATLEQSEHCFEHYELVKSADGTPVELDRGAMGITYKAVHVDLHCPVLLKPPAIRGLTESLTILLPSEWRTILARL